MAGVARPWRIEVSYDGGRAWRARTTVSTRESALRELPWWRSLARSGTWRARNRVTGEVIE